MLLLYLPFRMYGKIFNDIYIPLCFYFIRVLKPDGVLIFKIYIPLCFYFIYFSLHFILRVISIYIPLCFYFIPQNCFQPSQSNLYLHSTMLLLYLLGVHPDILILSHLHSTMLLLYQPEDKKPLTEERIYIPLCFYFIEYPFFSSQSI